MAPAPFTALARVVKSHGLKGEVAVEPAADLPFVLPIGLEVWFVPPPAGVRTGLIENVRRGPKGPLVKVSGVDDIGVAQKLVGADIMVRSDQLPEGWDEPVEAEDDPVGLTVTDAKRGDLGTIVEVIFTGANDVWVVEGPFGEVLLPVIDDVVRKIDWDAGSVAVTLLEGLLPDDATTP
ncbi:MAG: ribosome maturation factor RimM [Coriobacteriia bacterium]|nr:ribosome maturation factor RimM [Coriobacteriia bacterium]